MSKKVSGAQSELNNNTSQKDWLEKSFIDSELKKSWIAFNKRFDWLKNLLIRYFSWKAQIKFNKYKEEKIWNRYSSGRTPTTFTDKKGHEWEMINSDSNSETFRLKR